jgi:hypothetical protein
MSYSYTVAGKVPMHNGLTMAYGTFTDAAAAGSSIVTGLVKVVACQATSTISAAIGIVESGTAGTLTVKAANDGTDDGNWLAFGL